jgi:hypothetical protein
MQQMWTSASHETGEDEFRSAAFQAAYFEAHRASKWWAVPTLRSPDREITSHEISFFVHAAAVDICQPQIHSLRLEGV